MGEMGMPGRDDSVLNDERISPSASGGVGGEASSVTPASDRVPLVKKGKWQSFVNWLHHDVSLFDFSDDEGCEVKMNPLESLTEGAHYHRDARILRSSFRERVKDMYEFLAGKVTDWQFKKGEWPKVKNDVRMGLLSFILPAELLFAKAAEWSAEASGVFAERSTMRQ